jgi:hypothetical protein
MMFPYGIPVRDIGLATPWGERIWPVPETLLPIWAASAPDRLVLVITSRPSLYVDDTVSALNAFEYREVVVRRSNSEAEIDIEQHGARIVFTEHLDRYRGGHWLFLLPVRSMTGEGGRNANDRSR